MFCQIDRILPFILAESIKEELSLSDTQIGLTTGVAFAVCYTLLSLPIARVADRGSPRLVLVSCILVWSAMTAVGGFAAGFALLAASRLGVAIGEAGAIPSAHALIARKIAPAGRGLAIGLFSMGIPLGTMVGFAAGGAIADTLGWRAALIGAGAISAVVGLAVLAVTGPTPSPPRADGTANEPFLQTSRRLLAQPAFRWLVIGGVALGFATAPFYAFSAPFLIRTHGFTASEVGLAFGLLQGGMGVIGTLGGGRLFDRAVAAGHGRVIGAQGILLLLAAATTTLGLFAPAGWMSIALFVPGMLSFAFLLPAAFGAAHLVAGPGRQALASSLLLIGSGLFGPALAPLLVGLVSDAAGAAQVPNGLGLGLLIVPVASVLAGLATLVANRRIAALIAPGR
ncbi:MULTISPECIES: MFS transporter [unclassified Phenylobacterium]|nr:MULTISPECIES: MFS transporter [unclassified Phenylobacterium]